MAIFYLPKKSLPFLPYPLYLPTSVLCKYPGAGSNYHTQSGKLRAVLIIPSRQQTPSHPQRLPLVLMSLSLCDPSSFLDLHHPLPLLREAQRGGLCWQFHLELLHFSQNCRFENTLYFVLSIRQIPTYLITQQIKFLFGFRVQDPGNYRLGICSHCVSISVFVDCGTAQDT